MATLNNVIKWPFEAIVTGFLTSLTDIWRLWRLERKSAKLAKKLRNRMEETGMGFRPNTPDIHPLLTNLLCWLGENGVNPTEEQGDHVIVLTFGFAKCTRQDSESGWVHIAAHYHTSDSRHMISHDEPVNMSCEMSLAKLRYKTIKLVLRAVEEAKHPDSPRF